MQIIEPYAKMLPLQFFVMFKPRSLGPTTTMAEPFNQFTPDMGLALIRHIEWCSRISHRTEEAVTEDSWKRIIQNVVIEHGDWSVTEHASVSVDFYVDRGITHELVRHRLFAFTQESTRFVNYQKKMAPSFVKPPGIGIESTQIWQEAVDGCELAYQRLISGGCAPQIARSVFPNALASRIIVTGNLRNWRHVLIMRTSKETHPQFKQVSIPLLKEFQEKIPLLFDDIIPEQKQSEAQKRAR